MHSTHQQEDERNPDRSPCRGNRQYRSREGTVRLKYGGINVPKAVDTFPMRRVDSAIGFITEAVLKSSRKTRSPRCDPCR